MKVNIIYHNADLDGFCSGAIARKYMEGIGHECNMIGWNYGDAIPEINTEEYLIMTDISFPSDVMSRLKEQYSGKKDGDFIWIDHHISAMIDSDIHMYSSIRGNRVNGDSASLLAWKYFFPAQKIPSVVYWVDRYDVWKKKDPENPDASWDRVMNCQHGMRFHLSDPANNINYEKWNDAFEIDTHFHIIENDGSVIAEAEKITNKVRCSKAFDVEFCGYKFAALNNGLSGSAVLESYATEEHQGLMVFSYHGRKQMWEISMYKNDKHKEQYDFSLIAKQFGGGGHAGACGFMVTDIKQVINQ